MSDNTLSVLLPGIHPECWPDIYEQLKQSIGKYSFELLCSGHNKPDEDFLSHPNIRFVKDYGSPSRRVQMLSTLAQGKYVCCIFEDGKYRTNTLEQCIDLFEKELKHKDGICIRYLEKDMNPNAPLPPQPPQWPNVWSACYHRDLQLPGVPDNAIWHGSWMYLTTYFREIGGLDCRFEHINMNCNDLAFRVQAAGGKVYTSPDFVMDLDNRSNNDLSQSPIIRAFLENDQPLFNSIYKEKNAAFNRIKIDYDNWKLAEEFWTRAYGEL